MTGVGMAAQKPLKLGWQDNEILLCNGVPLRISKRKGHGQRWTVTVAAEFKPLIQRMKAPDVTPDRHPNSQDDPEQGARQSPRNPAW